MLAAMSGWLPTWAGIALALLCCFAVAAAGQSSGSTSSLGIEESGYAVPIRIENDLLYMGGSIRQSQELAFVVDTGSPTTSLDPQVASAVQVTAGAATPLLAGRRYFPQQSFQLAPTGYIAALSGLRTAGVLGASQFIAYSLAIDFDRKLAALLSPEVCPSTAARLPIFTAGGLPFVKGTIPLAGGEQATGLFLVDTGQPGPGVVLAASFVDAHPALAAGAKWTRPTAANQTETLLRLKELHLGPLVLHAPIAVVEQATQSGGDPRLAGVLGLAALSRFNFVLNRRYASLYLEPNARMHAPFEADMSGLLLRASEERGLVVEAVAAASPAALAQLQAGDVLVRMEDRPLTAANLGSVAEALRSVPGAAVHLEISRNGKPQRVLLRLKRML